MKDYRKIYADYYGIKWDSKLFEIHHIDRNRENNDVHNLVLLPKKLHKEYHRIISIIQNDFENGADIFNVTNFDIFHANEYVRLFELKYEIANLYLFQSQFKLISNNLGINEYKEILKKYFNGIYQEYCEE